MSKFVFYTRENVNKHFKEVWESEYPYNVLSGGRNSFKSSVISLLLVFKMIKYIQQNKKANVVVIRKVNKTIRDSVFNKIQWALRKFGIMNEFTTTVSPFKITHIKTGSSFYFYGQDDFSKLKSNDIENLIAVWFEEAAEFSSKEDFDQTEATFMRQKHPAAPFVQFFWSFNPPKNPYSWINEWVEEIKNEESYLYHHSSYLDDDLGFVTDQMLEKIELIKKNDYDYYRYLYLGEPVGLGTNVYKYELFQQTKELPNFLHLFFSIDTGHQVSATSCGAYGLTPTGKVVKIDTYYYSPAGKANKKAPSELSKDLYEFMKSISQALKMDVTNITIDSAEGGIRNQMYSDYNISLHPVAKKKKIDMIDYTHILLAEGRFFVYAGEPLTNLPQANNNHIFLEEVKKYQYKENTLNTDDPQVVKEDDHSVDEFQYFVLDNLSYLGIGV